MFLFCFWIKDRMLIKMYSATPPIFWAAINFCVALLLSVESLNFWKHKVWNVFPRGHSNVPFYFIVLIFRLCVSQKKSQPCRKEFHLKNWILDHVQMTGAPGSELHMPVNWFCLAPIWDTISHVVTAVNPQHNRLCYFEFCKLLWVTFAFMQF